MTPTAILALGLVNWISTTIVVESELMAPMRDWLTFRRDLADERWTEVDDIEDVRRVRRLARWATFWAKTRYLATCHLCAGTWIGLLLTAVFGSPWPGVLGWLAGGLLVKAVGHLILELRPQAWR